MEACLWAFVLKSAWKLSRTRGVRDKLAAALRGCNLKEIVPSRGLSNYLNVNTSRFSDEQEEMNMARKGNCAHLTEEHIESCHFL